MIKAAEKGLLKIGALLVRPALNTQNLIKGKNVYYKYTVLLY